jgi:hypothetical protein
MKWHGIAPMAGSSQPIAPRSCEEPGEEPGEGP